MYVALRNLPLTPSMRDALIDHAGAGKLLDCVTAIENGEFERANSVLDEASDHYLEAVAWSNDAGKHLFGADDAVAVRRRSTRPPDRSGCLPPRRVRTAGASLSGLELVAACGLGDLAGRRELGEGGADRRAPEPGSWPRSRRPSSRCRPAARPGPRPWSRPARSAQRAAAEPAGVCAARRGGTEALRVRGAERALARGALGRALSDGGRARPRARRDQNGPIHSRARSAPPTPGGVCRPLSAARR